MNDYLSEDNRSHIRLKRMMKSTGSTLRKRYAWLVTIICFLIGGGVIAAVNNLTSNATKSILEDETLLDQSKRSAEKVERLSVNLDDEYEEVDIDASDVMEGKTTLLKKLYTTSKQLQLLDQKVNSLEETVDSILEKQGISRPISTRKNTLLTHVIGHTAPENYTIYIQYSQKNDKSKMLLLQQYLKSKGYIVPAVEAVKSRQRDIRYFHAAAYNNAVGLKNHLKDFIKNSLKEEAFEIKIKNFGKAYPNAQKNALELWLYF